MLLTLFQLHAWLHDVLGRKTDLKSLHVIQSLVWMRKLMCSVEKNIKCLPIHAVIFVFLDFFEYDLIKAMC